MDQLYGSISAFEILEFENCNNVKKDATFKATKKIEDVPVAKNASKDEEANFVRRLKRGSKKYKGKFPFKCFNCGGIGHYVARCPFKQDDYKRLDDDNKRKDNFRNDVNKRIDDTDKPKKSFYSV